jgi:hypothetical protein
MKILLKEEDLIVNHRGCGQRHETGVLEVLPTVRAALTTVCKFQGGSTLKETGTNIIGKGHPVTCHEDPEEDYEIQAITQTDVQTRYSSTLSLNLSARWGQVVNATP